MLTVSKLAFEYPDMKLLSNITFSLKAGYALQVTGPNGVGKTTLLKLIAGILIPSDGEVAYEGGLSYLTHQYGVNLHLTPFEHLRFDLDVSEVDAQEQMRRFILDTVSDKPIGLLSDGQKRRVSLMQLVFSTNKLWLLDEPLVGLDAKGMALLGELMQQHLKDSGTIVFTSHQALPFALPFIEALPL